MATILDICEYPFAQLEAGSSPVVIDNETIGIMDKEAEEPATFIDNPRSRVIYFSWAANDLQTGAGSCLTQQGMNFLKALCASKRPKICHNIKADFIFLRNTGIHLEGPYYDTILAHSLLDEHSIHKLKYLSPTILHHDRSDEDVLHTKWKLFPKQVCNYMCLTEGYQPELHEYSRRDARDTLELWNLFEPQLLSQNLWGLYETLLKAEMAFVEMEIRGIKIDLEKVNYTLSLLLPHIEEMKSKMFTVFEEVFNPASSQQLVKVLVKHIHLTQRNEPTEKEIKLARAQNRQPLGSLCTSKEILAKWLYDERIQYLFAFRFLSKAASSLANYKQQIASDGRAHPNVKQTTRTGRTSISGIPLQQIPKNKGRLTELDVGDKELADKCSNAYRMVRKAFIAQEPAYLISNDYKQIEYYVAAHYTQSERLLALLNTGIDFHEMTCKLVFGFYNDDTRRLIKIINYGVLYGMGIPLLSATIAAYCKEPAQQVLARYEREVPEMRALQESVASVGKRRGYVMDVFGRRYHYLPGFEYKLICYLCQGTAAHIKKIALIRLRDLYANTQSGVVADIHDDLVQEVYPADAHLLPAVKKAMEDFTEFSVPIMVDMAIGKNLLDMKHCNIEDAQKLLQGG